MTKRLAKAALTRFPQLRPAFAKDGTITAATSSSISGWCRRSGADARKRREGEGADACRPRHRHRRPCPGPGAVHHRPRSPAIQKVLERAGWSVEDVDLFEVNEAFACVAMFAMRDSWHPA